MFDDKKAVSSTQNICSSTSSAPPEPQLNMPIKLEKFSAHDPRPSSGREERDVKSNRNNSKSVGNLFTDPPILTHDSWTSMCCWWELRIESSAMGNITETAICSWIISECFCGILFASSCFSEWRKLLNFDTLVFLGRASEIPWKITVASCKPSVRFLVLLKK